MEKTILKLYGNGDVESPVPITQSVNLFDMETSTRGFILHSNGSVQPFVQDSVYSEYIPVAEGGTYTLQVSWNADLIPIAQYGAWSMVYGYDANFNPVGRLFMDVSDNIIPVVAYHNGSFVIPTGISYVIVTANCMIDNGRIEFYRSGIYFSENSIAIPKIIEYPPSGYRNYFIEKTSEYGYVVDSSGLQSTLYPYARTSDFIDVAGWSNGTIRVVYKNGDGTFIPRLIITVYSESKNFVLTAFNNNLTSSNLVGDFEFEYTAPIGQITYLRVSVVGYDHPNCDVTVSAEKSATATKKHYLAFEDMPEWVKDTGNPISIFPEGIVIKGNLLESNS